jgi:hypothetical protein
MGKLSKCVWKVIRTYFEHAVPYSGIVPGASIVVQSYGDFLDLNPHLHAIVADGGFFEDNSFRVAPQFVGKNLEKAFQYEVLKMLKKEGKINDTIIENLLSWRHTGFHVYLGPRIWPDDHDALERLARYIIRACFSSDRMVYIPAEKTPNDIAKVIYTSKDGKSSQTFDALDWLARLVTHVPGRYEHTVRCYGYYSNKSRGMRKKADADDHIATIAPNELSPKQFAQNWARLIPKIYEVDPLVCPQCQGNMRIIAFIAPICKRHHVSSDFFLLLARFFENMLNPRLDSGFFLEISKLLFT